MAQLNLSTAAHNSGPLDFDVTVTVASADRESFKSDHHERRLDLYHSYDD